MAPVMNERFLAICLFFFAGCALGGLIAAALLAARARSPASAIMAAIVALGVTAVLVNAGVDLW
jgi:hypothetical protein